MRIESSYCAASGIPLGGVGTGSVEIRADGRLYEWHIFNNGPWAWRREDREREFMGPRDLFFAVRTKTSQGSVRVRLLRASRGYELGGDPYTFPWLRSVDRVQFDGEPPFAFLRYVDEDLPVDVELEAFSPFIPGDVENSTIPAAIFVFRVGNRTDEEVEFSLLAGMKNPFSEVPAEAEVSAEEAGSALALTLRGIGLRKAHCMYGGSMTLALVSEGERGYCLDAPYDDRSLRYKWVEFRATGLLRDERRSATVDGRAYAVVACRRRLGPREKATVVAVLAWFFPNHYDDLGNYLGHFYENRFSSSRDVAEYVVRNFEGLYGRTRRFHDLLYSTSVDRWLVDLIASQLTTMVKSTYYTRDGLFGVWEGYGCCGLNTTDVAFYGSVMVLQLFPELERAWVRYHAEWQLRPGLSPYYEVFALAIPENVALFKEELRRDPSVAADPEKFREAVMRVVERTGKDPRGRVMHYFTGSFKRPDTYDRPDMNPEYALIVVRDALWLGDEELLRSLWPAVKEAIEVILRTHDPLGLKLPYHYTPAGYEAIHQSAARRLGFAERYAEFLSYVGAGYTFYPTSVQTFDAWSLIGVTSFTGVLWLAALKAVERAARVLGDGECAERARRLFEEGRENLVKHLWNGEYLDLWYDPVSGKRDRGCSASQLDGQMYLTLLLGLGYVLDRERTLKILRSIFKYNFTEEEGLINGVYPGRPRPALAGDMPLPNETGLRYTVGSQIDTPWTGIEFEVAAHMISEGMVEEGLRILRAVHERYARYGEYWNHIECGGHYYRAMDSWLVLMALEGLLYDGFERRLRFVPRVSEKSFRGLLTVAGAWGSVEQVVEGGVQRVAINLERGTIRLRALELGKFGEAVRVEVAVDGKAIEASLREGEGTVVVELSEEVALTKELVVKVYYRSGEGGDGA